ncbi:hypothetical protein [Actinoplanes utahensis]|uniref:Uncharacterized protein n=1 Tax=Actinoplanes utahensis TaxID=1869 RepID=A0A0A6UER3_ACTUT|nr:hypothetical protein [Actinoplanes utahensis]KHD74535.1 hypothetical protein MB27_28390 [Actinoplanes utahensis]GIF28787.1 hypothetical protein Aut01nite_17730 [Actinoplanes utahensis]
MSGPGRALGAATLLAVLAVAGCDTPVAPKLDTSLAPPEAKATAGATFDPPVRFQPTALNIGWPNGSNVLLRKNLAFYGDSKGLTVTDVLTGKTVGVLAPGGAQAAGGGTPLLFREHPSVLVRTSAGERVAAVYPVAVAAAGTSRNRNRLEVVTADATTGKGTGSVVLDAPATPANGADAHDTVRIAGTHGDVVVLVFGASILMKNPETVAVDVITGRTLWRRAGLRAGAVLGDTLLAQTGTKPAFVSGLGVADGGQRWKALQVPSGSFTITAAGPDAAAVAVSDHATGKRSAGFLDSAGRLTGRISATRVGDCHYDEQAITVCSLDGDEVAGFDAATGRELWRLPTADRLAPRVTFAWHGAVYGRVKSDAVVLDARTGADREAEAGIDPIAVNEYGGVSNVPQFHPAAG